MPERKQILIRVSPEQADDWEQFQEELGFQNRSEMIRRAVEDFYVSRAGDDDGESNEALNRGLEKIEDKIDILRADVGDVRREQLTLKDVDDIAEEVGYRLSKEDLLSVDDLLEGHVDSGVELDEDMEEVATEQYLTGFARAVGHIEDSDERERMKNILHEQVEEMWDGDFSVILDEF